MKTQTNTSVRKTKPKLKKSTSSTEDRAPTAPTKARADPMEAKAEAIIWQRHPAAQDVTYLETRDFLDGKLVVVAYTFDTTGPDELAYVYFDELDKRWMPRVCTDQDEMASLVNDLRYRNSGKLSHKITDYVFREGGAAVAIAILLMAVLAYAVFTGHQADLGEKFWNVFLLVVGFYFGSNAPARSPKAE